MAPKLSLRIKEALQELDIQLLDIYRKTQRKGDDYIIEDIVRVKDKHTGKVLLVNLGSAKESMEIEDIKKAVVEAFKELEKESKEHS